MAELTPGRLVRAANVAVTTAGQQMEDQPLGAAIADLAPSSLPANGTIGGLAVGATYSQAEVQALRDECENLRDALSATIDAFNALKAELEESGSVPLFEDS